jgi:hypothetical protein
VLSVFCGCPVVLRLSRRAKVDHRVARVYCALPYTSQPTAFAEASRVKPTACRVGAFPGRTVACRCKRRALASVEIEWE